MKALDTTHKVTQEAGTANGATSANESKNLYTPRQSAFQKQGGEQISMQGLAIAKPPKKGGGGTVGVWLGWDLEGVGEPQCAAQSSAPKPQ